MPKILIIDDRKDNLLSVKAIIKNYEPDYEVLVAQNGPKGIEMAVSERPETILLDIHMPEMDGFEVCRRLRRNKETQQIPIIFLTAVKTNPADKIKGLEIGGDAYLTKPIDSAELMAQVKVMLRIKKAEDANLYQYESIVSSSSDMLALLDTKFTYISVNKTYADAFNMTPDQLIGKTPEDMFGKESFETTTIPYAERAMRGEEVRFESKIDFPATGKQDMEINFLPYYDKYGEISGFMVNGRNISERKQAETDLKKSEKRFRNVAESVSDWIWEVDADGVYTYSSGAAPDILGIQNEDIIGKTPFDFMAEDEAKRVGAIFGEIAKAKRAFRDLENWNITKDGRSICLLTSGVPILSEDGELQGYRGVDKDITERKQAEKSLQLSDERFTLAMKASNDGLFDWNLETNEIYYSPAWKKMIGYEDHELPNDFSVWDKTTAPDDVKKSWEMQQKLISKQIDRFVLEFKMKHKDGNWVDILSRASAIFDDEGQAIRIVGTHTDITERKQAEVKISEALLIAEQANSVKDQFIANISHEIRTPLNSIIGFSDLFHQRYGDLVRDKDKDIFGFITNSSNRLMRTVDSILNLSQLDAGVINIEKRELDLNYIVRAVIGEIKPQVDEKGLDLTYNATDQHAMVLVDNYSTHQAILNLIDNAVKYTLEGKIELKLTQKKDSYRLSIQDTGIGISEEYQKRIFDPYTQESEGFTKNYQGIGLGLALTKHYLDLNDVELELVSQKNVGTTFTLIFPKHEGS